MSDHFGEFDSRNMPEHFFWECISLDHDSAIQADISLQNYTICPRYWYVDATFKCKKCDDEFCFTAVEQKRWYGQLGFYVDSYAKHCPNCRKQARHAKELRQEYDGNISRAIESNDISLKKRICQVIDDMCGLNKDLPERIHANRKTLSIQIAKSGK